MPAHAGTGRQLIAVAVLSAVCYPATAQEYGAEALPLPPASDPARNVQPGPTPWPEAEPASRPEQLPADNYRQPLQPRSETAAGYASPASAETTSPGGPLPLSRRSHEAPSPIDALTQGGAAGMIDAATSLGIVLVLFLMVAWAVRRGMPKGSGLLPTEAVEVLGRVPLGGRQQAQLVRCGNKIVLLSLTSSGAQQLAEITDPAEVDRLHSICQPAAATGGLWRRMFGGYSAASRPGDYYLRDEAAALDFRHLDTPSRHHA